MTNIATLRGTAAEGMRMKTDREVIEGALALIEADGGWAQGTYCRDAEGVEVPPVVDSPGDWVRVRTEHVGAVDAADVVRESGEGETDAGGATSERHREQQVKQALHDDAKDAQHHRRYHQQQKEDNHPILRSAELLSGGPAAAHH